MPNWSRVVFGQYSHLTVTLPPLIHVALSSFDKLSLVLLSHALQQLTDGTLLCLPECLLSLAHRSTFHIQSGLFVTE